MNLLVFVVVNTKMKKDYAEVETLILNVLMNVFVFHHTLETLGVNVVVLKLILTKLLLMPMEMLYGEVVNATVLCREVKLMKMVLFTVSVMKATNLAYGDYTNTTLLLMIVTLFVLILMLKLSGVLIMMSMENGLVNVDNSTRDILVKTISVIEIVLMSNSVYHTTVLLTNSILHIVMQNVFVILDMNG